MIDLHLHTTASDGRLTAVQLVDRALQAGLTVIAVTDHDTVQAVDEVSVAAAAHGIRVIPGIEVTAVEDGRDVHMLAYFVNQHDSALTRFLGQQRGRREERAREIDGTPEAEDISVFPMAIPMIAGPGSIASVMLLTARADGLVQDLVVLAAMTVVILLTLVALLMAGPLMRLIGAKLEAMITRILGVILAALAAQFVLDGLERSLPGLAG